MNIRQLSTGSQHNSKTNIQKQSYIYIEDIIIDKSSALHKRYRYKDEILMVCFVDKLKSNLCGWYVWHMRKESI